MMFSLDTLQVYGRDFVVNGVEKTKGFIKKSGSLTSTLYSEALFQGYFCKNVGNGDLVTDETGSFLVRGAHGYEWIQCILLKTNATIAVKRKEEFTDDFGNVIVDWVEKLTTEAMQQKVTTKLREDNPGIMDNVTHLFHFQTGDVEKEDRIYIGDVYFEVEFVDEITNPGLVIVQVSSV